MTPSRCPLIVGNWKMNRLRGDGRRLASALARRLREEKAAAFDLVICPPFTLLAEVGKAIAGSAIALGAQDCHAEADGAHTGDISAAMLADLGCAFVIVGHSERRSGHGETDAAVNAKAEAATAAGLVPIICVGETAAERARGETLAVVGRQLAGSLPAPAERAAPVVAYEPVWAIGSGRTPTAGEVEAVHAFIRGELAARLGGAKAAEVRLLYGGSVKAANAGELLRLPQVDGGLIGGASLDADEFWAIARSCH